MWGHLADFDIEKFILALSLVVRVFSLANGNLILWFITIENTYWIGSESSGTRENSECIERCGLVELIDDASSAEYYLLLIHTRSRSKFQEGVAELISSRGSRKKNNHILCFLKSYASVLVRTAAPALIWIRTASETVLARPDAISLLT